MKRSTISIAALSLAALFGLGAMQAAEASTAANTRIRNTVTVSYNDAGGNIQTPVTATADITVNLVVTPPLLNSPADQITNAATNAVFNYTITSNANGNDSYNLTVPTTTESAGITGSTTSLSIASVSLGGTTLAAATDGTATITVPYDGADDGTVNGIAVGETIVIGGAAYIVNAGGITENSGTNLATITLTANVPAGTAAGSIVGERRSFNLTVDPGTLSASSDQTVDVTVSARDDNDIAAATTDVTRTTVQVPLTVTKQVSLDGGATFPAGPVNANPGATLTYRITVTNPRSTDVTSVVITDPRPQFTTYVDGSAKRATGAASTYAAAAGLDDDTAGAPDDGYDYNITTGNTATYNVGTIAPGAGNAVQLFFQVTVN